MNCPHANAIPVNTLAGELVAWLCPDCDAQINRLPPAERDALSDEMVRLIRAYEWTPDPRGQRGIREKVARIAGLLAAADTMDAFIGRLKR